MTKRGKTKRYYINYNWIFGSSKKKKGKRR